METLIKSTTDTMKEMMLLLKDNNKSTNNSTKLTDEETKKKRDEKRKKYNTHQSANTVERNIRPKPKTTAGSWRRIRTRACRTGSP